MFRAVAVGAAGAALLLLGCSAMRKPAGKGGPQRAAAQPAVPASAAGSATAAAADLTPAELLTIKAFRDKLAQRQPQPTGDALFDRYAAAVWQRNAPAAYLQQGLESSGCLPDSVLAGWAADFGHDPRYWQLRYSCAQGLADQGVELSADGSILVPSPDDVKQGDPARFLQQAVDAKCYDAATLEALFLVTLIQQEAPRDPSAQHAIRLKDGGGVPLMALADRMVAEFPQESNSWYRRAMLKFVLGDDAGGFDDLKHGNAAPSNRALLLFPYSAAVDGVAGGHVPGSRELCGMINTMNGSVRELRNASLGLDDCSQLESQTAKSLDYPQWPAVFEFSIRLAEQRGDLATFSASSLSASHRLSGDLLVQHPPTLTAEQCRNLWTFSSRYWKLVRLQAQSLDNRALNNKYDDEAQLRWELGIPEGKENDPAVLQVVKAADLGELYHAAKTGTDVSTGGIRPDLGWADLAIEGESLKAENGADRTALINEIAEFGAWDWTKLEFTKDK
jgi:hypothetical protein